MALFQLISEVSIKMVFYGSLLILVVIKIFINLFSAKVNNFTDLKKLIFTYLNSAKINFKNINLKRISFWYSGFLNVLVVVCIILLTLHFIDYAYNNYEYGFSDIIRHELICGEIFSNQAFSDGYYPIGMHAIIGSVIYLFQLDAHFTFLVCGNLFVILFFIALYFWLKNIFQSKTAVTMVFLAFVLLTTTILLQDVSQRVIYDGLHRFNWTLPQEMCLWAVFVSPICIMKILKSKKTITHKTNIANFVMLALSVAITLCVHYYTTIFQFVTCLVTFLVYVNYLNKEKFKGFTVSVLSGIFIGSINLFIGLLSSGKFAWALEWASDVPSGDSRVFDSIASVNVSEQNVDLLNNSNNIFMDFAYHIKAFYDDALAPLFPGNWLTLFVVFMFLSLVVFVLLAIFRKNLFQNYLPIALSMIVFLILYAAPVIGLPRLLESYRLVICIYATLLAFCCVSFDVGINLLKIKFQVQTNKKAGV